MAHTAIVTFTAKPLAWVLRDGGSRDWRLDSHRAQKIEYLICTQNRHNPEFGAPDAPHRSAFLIGRILGVVPSPSEPGRWLIRISEYTPCAIPNIWGKFGHVRYPVWYTTLEELGIDLDALPPFRPVPVQLDAWGMSETTGRPVTAAADWPNAPSSATEEHRPTPAGVLTEQETERRMDAILGQLDRVPDLAQPFDPFGWDAHGLPR